MATKNERGNWLREGREGQQKSIQECAAESHVASTTWQKWEYGQTEPKDFDTAEKASQAAGISLDRWITGKECQPTLPIDEMIMLNAYKALTPELQRSLMQIIIAIHKAESIKRPNDPT